MWPGGDPCLLLRQSRAQGYTTPPSAVFSAGEPFGTSEDSAIVGTRHGKHASLYRRHLLKLVSELILSLLRVFWGLSSLVAWMCFRGCWGSTCSNPLLPWDVICPTKDDPKSLDFLSCASHNSLRIDSSIFSTDHVESLITVLNY